MGPKNILGKKIIINKKIKKNNNKRFKVKKWLSQKNCGSIRMLRLKKFELEKNFK